VVAVDERAEVQHEEIAVGRCGDRRDGDGGKPAFGPAATIVSKLGP